MFRFQHIEYLLALAAIPLLLLLFLKVIKWKESTIKKIGDPFLVKELIRGHSPTRFLVKFILMVLAFATVILGIANLQKPAAIEDIDRKGVDIVIALDVSKSMLASDIKPSRLDRAKQFINKLMDQLQNDRVGLVLFAGRAYMQMPLTTDHVAAKMYVQNSGPHVVPSQGTVLTEALRMGNTAFNSQEKKYKAIVLVTDGEDHDPNALQTAQVLAGNGVMINTVGIGFPEGVPIIDPVTNEYKKDQQGSTVITRLNESLLVQLASATHGVYVRLDDMDASIQKVLQQLGTIEKTPLSDRALLNYKSYYQWFLGSAIFLLLLEFFLPERKINPSR